MKRHFDDELGLLKKGLLEMADHTLKMIDLAVRAATEREPKKIQEVREIEEEVNRREVEVEEEVLRLLAVRQPAAGDLRLLIALSKINNDLERVADQAVNIAGTAEYLLKEPPLKSPVDIAGMALRAQRMLRHAIDAFVNHDPKLAKSVCEDDDAVDKLKDSFFEELLKRMSQDPASIHRAVYFLLISRNLERIADHATNIAEDVIFIEEGRNIKHHLQDGE